MSFSHCNAVVMCMVYLNTAWFLLAGYDSSGTFCCSELWSEFE